MIRRVKLALSNGLTVIKEEKHTQRLSLPRWRLESGMRFANLIGLFNCASSSDFPVTKDCRL